MSQLSSHESFEDSLDWESRKDDFPFWKHAVAGSCAGAMEHILLFPLDTIKTRVQALNSDTISNSSNNIDKEYKGGGGGTVNSSPPSNNFKISNDPLKTPLQTFGSSKASINLTSSVSIPHPSDSFKTSFLNSCKIPLFHSNISSTNSIPRFYSSLYEQFGFSTFKMGVLRNSITNLLAEGGILRLFRGVSAITFGCIPAHASYFSVYEIGKYYFGLGQSGSYSATQSAICGAMATVSHDIILTPMDLVKQRLQLGCYNGVFDCMRVVLKKEGSKALFRSIPTTLVMNIPFGAVTVSTNEFMKHLLGISALSSQDHSQSHDHVIQDKQTPNKQSELIPINTSNDFLTDSNHPMTQSTNTFQPVPNPYSSSTLILLYFICAGVGGGVAGFVTNPLDIIKTRLQTQDIDLQRENVSQILGSTNRISPIASMRYKSFTSTIRTMWHEEKIFGFWRGTLARITLSIPATAVSWGSYEFCKYLLTYNSLL